MKRRIFLSFSLVLLLSTFTLTSLFSGNVKAASSTTSNSSKAKSACETLEKEWYNTTKDPGNAHYNSCYDGYMQEIIYSKDKNSVNESNYCAKASEQSACTDGWNAAAKNIQGGTAAASAASKASLICQGKGGEELNLCTEEMTNSKQCEKYISNTNEARICFNGAWDKYNGKKDTYTGQYSAAYKTGYNNTQTDPSIAGSTVGGGDATPATCESSGWNLSWIVCPVINWAADAADGMYNDLILPLLQYQPVSLTNNSSDKTHTYAIWSGFRTYGDIFLIIALLVTVFAEAFGGGLIDAYTVKKILPRLLVAAVLINLSIYIVALAVDATNIIGGGVQNLIQAPFSNVQACSNASVSNGTTNCFHFYLNSGTSDTLGIVGLVGGAATGGVIWGLAHVAGAATMAVDFIAGLAITVVLPAVLTFLSILVTLIIRQGLILILILVSPVAFALYCLPNTEKYFRQWWDLLFRTLLIYPIIGVAFAVANILSITIGSTTHGLSNALATFLSIFVMFIPLVMIPYAFRIAGGIIGRTHEAVAGLRDRGHKTLQERLRGENSWYGRRKQQQAKNVADWRAGVYERGLHHGGAIGLAQRTLIGGRRAFETQSAMNALADKRISDLSASGNDDLARASTITASSLRGTNRERQNNNGEMEYQAATGQWFTERQVNEGHNLFNTNADRQAAFKLIMSKTQNETPEYQNRVIDDFVSYANDNHMDPRAASGMLAGITIPNQGMRADLRYGSIASVRDEATGQTRLTWQRGAAGHLDMLGTNSGFALAAQQPGNFGTSLQQSWDNQVARLNEIRNSGNPQDIEEAGRIRQRLTNAYGNLQKFVSDRSGPVVTNEEGERISGTSGAGGASSASYRTEQAARATRDYINNTISNNDNGLGFLSGLLSSNGHDRSGQNQS